MMKYALIKTMVAILVLSLTACASKGLVKPQDEKYRGLPYLVPTTEIPPTGVKRISARELKNRLSTSKRTVLIDVYGLSLIHLSEPTRPSSRSYAVF